MQLISLFLITLAFTLQAGTFRTLTNTQGNTIQAELLSKQDDKVTFRIKGKYKTFTVIVTTLSVDDQKFIEKWNPQERPSISPGSSDNEGLNSSLYPRSKKEIRAKIREIQAVKSNDSSARDEFEAIQMLNTYRYLCGVKPDVTMSTKMNDEAKQAAEACKKNGGLSHDIGSFTDKCNLSSGGDVVESVTAYMNDSGDNNRERRGHRKWCLNPAMGESGFGSAGASYSAMWSLDHSASKSSADTWSYPGKGFYPTEYMHGNGWSLYLSEDAPAKDELKITVHKLSKRPDKLFGWNDEIPGKDFSVNFIFTYGNAINFEPEGLDPKDSGIYYVTVKGGHVRERYIVELF